MPINMIVAMDENRGIGFENNIPWNLKTDMKHFKQVTLNTVSGLQPVVIMGRKTWESLKQPLPNRINVVITKQKINDVLCFTNLKEAINFHAGKEIFLIGGFGIYKEGLKYADNIYVTKINKKYVCDVYMVYFENDFQVDNSYTVNCIENDVTYQIMKYIKKNVHDELQYINLIHDILSNGMDRSDRTGTGTISVFGRTMSFNLQKGFPLLTTKKMFFKGIFYELLWFLKGSVDNSELLKNSVHIWDGNSSREYLDSRGLSHYAVGELGPIYGFQWRHAGAEYTGIKDYTGMGVDQVQQLIEGIKRDPNSRRHIISAWNVKDLPAMAIPPCHVMCQFYVHNGFLDCQLYQRSGDVGLGVPFNIASYALLTHLVAYCCDLKPGKFIHALGDAHIYNNHIELIKTQLGRVPYEFPKLTITGPKDIFEITIDNIKLENYNSHPAIKMTLSV
jgi:dihydrofolate reductase / thymidylate synthase